MVGLIAFGAALLAQLSLLLAVVVGANAMFVTYLALVAIEVPRLTPEFLRRHAGDENVPVWRDLPRDARDRRRSVPSRCSRP